MPRALNIARIRLSGSSSLMVVLEVPVLRDLFRFATLHADDIAVTIGAGLLSVGWFEIVKSIGRRRHLAHVQISGTSHASGQ